MFLQQLYRRMFPIQIHNPQNWQAEDAAQICWGHNRLWHSCAECPELNGAWFSVASRRTKGAPSRSCSQGSGVAWISLKTRNGRHTECNKQDLQTLRPIPAAMVKGGVSPQSSGASNFLDTCSWFPFDPANLGTSMLCLTRSALNENIKLLARD